MQNQEKSQGRNIHQHYSDPNQAKIAARNRSQNQLFMIRIQLVHKINMMR
jgi:hypothetical protein